MKKSISIILICGCLFAMHVTALAASGITVTASSSKAEAGDSITVSGTATADTWISIEGTDADENILYFSAALSDAAGAYSVTFKAPDMDDGTLTLTAGNGSMTASTTVEIDTPSSGDSDKDDEDAESSDGEDSDDEDAESSDDADADVEVTDSSTNDIDTSGQASQSAVASETPGSSETDVIVPGTTDATGGGLLSTLLWIIFGLLAAAAVVAVVIIVLRKKRK